MVKEDKPGDGSLESFLSIGLDERTAKNTITNNKDDYFMSATQVLKFLLRRLNWSFSDALSEKKSAILEQFYRINVGELLGHVQKKFPWADPKIVKDGETVVEIRAEYDPSKKTKSKGVLHWVARPSAGVEPLQVEVGLFDKLFLSENPADLDNWLADLNPQSKIVIPGAYAVLSLRDATVGERFQFERLGYFVVDKNSTEEKLVFICTVTLRDSYGKAGK